MLKHDWAMAIGHAALGFASMFCYAAAPACYAAMQAHVAGYQTWLAGGRHEDAFGAMIEAGAIGFISVAGNAAIGATFSGWSNVAAHAAFGCAMAEAQGGKCQSGALAGAVTAGADILTAKGGMLDTKNFAGDMAIAMVAGCAGSAAGGGKCSNGAASSALIYLYNANGIYNAQTDTVTLQVDVVEYWQASGVEPREVWAGQIAWSVEIPIDPILERILRIPLIDVELKAGTEVGYLVYKNQIVTRVDTVTIQGQRQTGRVSGNPVQTNQFVWRRDPSDNVGIRRTVYTLCVGNSC